MNQYSLDPVDMDQDADTVATAWFARQRSGEMTPADAAELERWLAADAAHVTAYDAVELTWRAAEALRAEPQVLAFREAALRARPAPSRRVVWGAIAASFVFAIVGGGAAYQTGHLSRLLPSRQIQDQEFRTGVGQQATVKLPDGSVVTLNTDTRLRTRADKNRRLLYLDRGQAYFAVAKDASRPFVVTAGGRTITALGTAFDVRVGPREFKVTLVEGKVRVETPAPTPAPTAAPDEPRPQAAARQVTELTPGSQLAATDDRHWSLTATDVDKETGWLRGQLIFEREPLGAVAAELNRYSTKKIVVIDPEAAARPITAAFRPGDVDGFVRAIRDYGFVRVVAEDEHSIRIRSAS